jgi:hypothetical protein
MLAIRLIINEITRFHFDLLKTIKNVRCVNICLNIKIYKFVLRLVKRGKNHCQSQTGIKKIGHPKRKC